MKLFALEEMGIGKWSARKYNVLLTLYENNVQSRVAEHSSVFAK